MDKKEEILNAASIVFRRYGFAKATLVDVGNECGLNKAGLYYYFKNKEELLQQMITYDVDKVKVRLAASLDSAEDFREGLKSYILTRLDSLQVLHHYADMFSNCVVAPSLRDFGIKHRFEFLEYEKQLLSRYIIKYKGEGNSLSKPLIQIIVGVTENIGKSILLGSAEEDYEKVIDEILDLVLPEEKRTRRES